MNICRLDWSATPLEVAAHWPEDLPLIMLHSGRLHQQLARWSILAAPGARYQFADGRSRWHGASASVPAHVAFAHDPLRDLNAVINSTGCNAGEADASLPFRGGWIGYLSYDLGSWIEARAVAGLQAQDDRRWPLIDLAWCPQALIYDHMHQQWYAAQWPGLVESDLRDFIASIASSKPNCSTSAAGLYAVGDLKPNIPRERYTAMVARAIEYIGAGDIFQANIAQRFSARFHGSTRALFFEAMEHSLAWYGAYLELPQPRGQSSRCVISTSPELFVACDPVTRQVLTRPIKGTRPTGEDVHLLQHSAKDRAELHMIVDLMRNDLGRVCEFGSMRVTHDRLIETHPTVHHGVAEVMGTLRAHASVADVLRAMFPGGSVTGAPKIRAMQIIDELEPVKRGPYCGAIGFFSNCGRVTLNIVIRTLLLTSTDESRSFNHFEGVLDYSAGAGIVADSIPELEYQETLDKCAILQRVLSAAQRSRTMLRPPILTASVGPHDEVAAHDLANR